MSTRHFVFAVALAVSSWSASAAETRPNAIAPDAFCRTLSATPGVTHVACDAAGRPAVVSGVAPDGQLYRIEYLYGSTGPAERIRINGGAPFSMVPVPDTSAVADRLKSAQDNANAQRMEMCASGEVVAAGTACGVTPKAEGVPVVGFCAYSVCYGDSYMLGPQNGTIRLGDWMDPNENLRQLVLCMYRRNAQLSACSDQYGNAALACATMGIFGAAAVFACEVGMAGMNQYCQSLAPVC